MPQVEVTFDIDANGILNVKAKDKATGKEQAITITSSSGLSKDEVEKLVKEAEANAAEDTRRRDAIEARNNLDNLVYQTQKLLDEHGDKLPADTKESIEAEIAGAKEALESDDVDVLKAKFDSLQAAGHKLAEVMYQQSGGEAPTGEAPAADEPEASGGDDVIDADFEEV